jgi:hypothetical protein
MVATKGSGDKKCCHALVGRTINTFYIREDQVVMGNWTIGIFCAYRERPNDDGKGPHECMGRTIDIFIPIGEDQVGWKRPACIYGKDQ